MIWVVDISPYSSNVIFHEDFRDAFHNCVVMPWARDQDKQINKLKKLGKHEDMKSLKADKSGYEYILGFEQKYNIYSSAKNHQILMQWKYQHKRWNFAKAPVYFDSGDGYIYECVDSIQIWTGFVVQKLSIPEFLIRVKNNCEHAITMPFF